ncbi:hypothetical protein [Anatilimnocola floriformis]|uniref:hypothetical protein n=1 Tax=Anatilimnocola floriformis TaxID=2948575 RepID=UPI0020C474DD|nr:hypothetical protein [Anatilimnocola floriformis]
MSFKLSPKTNLLRHWRDQFVALKKIGWQPRGRPLRQPQAISDRFVAFIGDGAAVERVNESRYREFFLNVTQSEHGDYYKRDTIPSFSCLPSVSLAGATDRADPQS